MKKQLIVLAGVAIVGAVAVIVWARGGSSHHRKPDTTAVHANGIDQTDSSVSLMTMLSAPEGATPCETAFNALEAEQAAARLHKGASMFKWVAPRATFVTECMALSDKAQHCMMPRYRRDHDDCVLARPPDAVLQKMFIPEPVVEEKLPGEP